MGALLKCFTGRHGWSLKLSPEAFGRPSKQQMQEKLAAVSGGTQPPANRQERRHTSKNKK